MPRTKTATEAPLIRLRMRVTHGETIAIGPGKIALLEEIGRASCRERV